jgi:WD40 repeat protein
MRRARLLWTLAALAALAGAQGQPVPPPSLASPPPPGPGPVIPVFLRSVARTDHTTLVGAWGPMDFWAASPLTAVAFSPDNRMLFAAARSGEIVGWDLGRYIPTWSIQAPSDADQGASLSVSPEGHLLLAPTRREPVALDVGGKRTRLLPPPPECAEGRCPTLALGTFFGQGGIAVAGKDSLLIWRRGVEQGQVDAPRMKEGEAFSAVTGAPREEVIAMGTELGRLILWDAKKSKPIKQGAAHSGRVLAAQFLADGKKVMTAGADGFLKMWDGKKGTLLKALRVIERAKRDEDEPRLSAVGFSPDGKLALTATVANARPGSELSLWNLQTGRRLWKVQDLLTRAIAFSPDAKLAALVVHDRGAQDEPRRIILLEVESGLSVLMKEGHLQRVTGLSVSPDGHFAVSASLDGTIKRWDAGAGTPTNVVGQHLGGVSDLAIGWKRQVAISAGSDGAVRLWSVKPQDVSGGPPPELVPPRTPAPGEIPPPPPPGKGKKVKGPPPPPVPAPLPMPSGEMLLDPRSLSLSPDERYALLPVSERKCARLEGQDEEKCATVYRLRKWDLKEARPLRDLYFADRSLIRPPCSAFLPESEEVLVGFDAVDAWTKKPAPLRVYVRDDQGVPVRSFADPDQDTLRALVMQPQGDLVLVASDKLVAPPEERRRGGVFLWNWRIGKKVRALVGHTDSVVTAAFSGDGQRVLTGSLDGTVRLWDTATARELEQLDLKSLLDDFPTAIAIAANAPTFLIGTEKGALLQFQLRR